MCNVVSGAIFLSSFFWIVFCAQRPCSSMFRTWQDSLSPRRSLSCILYTVHIRPQREQRWIKLYGVYSIPLSFSDGYWGDQEKPATATDKKMQTGHSNQGWEAGQRYLLTTNRQEDANRALQTRVGNRREIFTTDRQTKDASRGGKQARDFSSIATTHPQLVIF